MRRANDDPENRTITQEAAEWLHDYLTIHGPRVASSEVHIAGKKVGLGVEPLRRARRKLKLQVDNEGYPRVTYWSLSAFGPVTSFPRGETTTDVTDVTGQTGTGIDGGLSSYNPNAQKGQSRQSRQSREPPRVQPPLDKTDIVIPGPWTEADPTITAMYDR